MTHVPFTRRYDVERPVDGMAYDFMPASVVTGIVNVIGHFYRPAPYEWETIISRVCVETDTLIPSGDLSAAGLQNVLITLPWNRVCDACEGLYEMYATRDEEEYDSSLAVGFQYHLNRVFARNFFGYEMRDGQLERIGALTHDASVEAAKGILGDDDLAAPNEQFGKALRFYSARPEPDCANAVKEAVSAVEGLARILFGDGSMLLSEAARRLRDEKGTHGALAEMLIRLYGYRGDADGAAHGAVGARPIPLEEAELVIGVSANAIVYLARVFGRTVA